MFVSSNIKKEAGRSFAPSLSVGKILMGCFACMCKFMVCRVCLVSTLGVIAGFVLSPVRFLVLWGFPG